jgi:16S rRNA A1518/A1519 N6-dimethyltransferase RsmA/KsgA/DIM1 with predicted DNA glycosylase/AP lyase activity
VTSSIVRVDVRVGVRADPELFAFIRTCFAHRRKTLVKNLTMAGLDRARVAGGLRRLGLDDRVRAEALGLDALRELMRSVQGREDAR